jgi:hypothetical protein
MALDAVAYVKFSDDDWRLLIGPGELVFLGSTSLYLELDIVSDGFEEELTKPFLLLFFLLGTFEVITVWSLLQWVFYWTRACRCSNLVAWEGDMRLISFYLK